MISTVSDLLDKAAQDLTECNGALVFAGTDKMLSGGFDLSAISDLNVGRQLIVAGSDFMEKLLNFPRPVVVAATGHAVALGGFLLLAGDYRVGAATMKNGKPLRV